MNIIELRPVKLDRAYLIKWNEYLTDFVHLYKNGEKVNDTLYRIGGLGANIKNQYFVLMKYTEAFYEDSITTDPKRKPYLQAIWCIIDNNGIEKVEFEHFSYGYIEDGVVFSVGHKYYNIKTKEFYCESYSNMRSNEFIFLNNAYDKDKSKRGILKINKQDGTFELFPST